MKKITSVLACLAISILSFAQAPQKFNYQGVARGSSGNVFSNQLLGFKLSILQGSSTGSPVYVEIQSSTSDSKGIFSMEVGTGAVVSGNFSSINWGANTYWLKTEMDTTGGSNYQTMGTTQMSSVPYALNAGNGSPVGSVVAWMKNLTGVPALPVGWVECNGQVLSDTQSPLNGVTIPNLNVTQRFLRGATSSGSTGGSDTHTLTINEMPSHSHTMPSYLSAGGTNVNVLNYTAVNTQTANTSAVGGGQPHENRPAYYEVVWIIRVK